VGSNPTLSTILRRKLIKLRDKASALGVEAKHEVNLAVWPPLSTSYFTFSTPRMMMPWPGKLQM
jgi:hypothetical protein